MSTPQIFEVNVQKKLGGEYWINTWHIRANDYEAAIASAQYIFIFEIEVHTTEVEFTSARVSPYPGPSVGAIVPIGQFGQATAGDKLPLFNVVRLDFPVMIGRPSRKYLKLPVGEGQQSNGQLIQGTIDFVESRANLHLFNQAQIDLVSIKDQNLLSVVCYPSVGMRQLRRGSKRRLLPIIPVA